VRLRPDLAIVNTVDFFTPIVDDPYTFGQIAAANALSDIYAMGADPVTALNIVAFPRDDLDMEVLGAILQGGAERAAAAGTVVIGGHTIIDRELKYGMAVTGTVHPDQVIRNVGICEGDALILTKSLGTGIVTTALKKRTAPEASVEAAIRSMVELNRTASTVMRRHRVHACTDVTGFGLLGHAFEMANGSNVGITFEAAVLPRFEGACELADAGAVTGGCRRNREYLAGRVAIAAAVPAPLVEVAFDPQTSGGLLIAIAEPEATALVEDLRAHGVMQATLVGRAHARGSATVVLA
jgi:selenide,water dikinase